MSNAKSYVMIIEFTCGIYTATFNSIGGPKWFVKVNEHVVALIDENGILIQFVGPALHLETDDFACISVLMNNIKRQYKQLQTNSQDGSLGNG